MSLSQCNHIRIRDDNLYEINVEHFIKSIETKCRIDFRSLPQWKELLKRLHVSTTDCKRRIQDANLRKLLIINKLYTQITRNSPFELTENLARTSDKWEAIGRHKVRKLTLKSDLELVQSESETIQNEISETSFTVHQNTEVMENEVGIGVPLKSNVISDTKVSDTSSPLPVKICVNQHKYLSPLNSWDLIFETKNSSSKIKSTQELMISKESLVINNTSVKSNPKEIYITKNKPLQQVLKFSIVNCTLEYMHLRFLCLAEETPFETVKILPPTPQKLYPGLPVTFRLFIKLKNDLDNFTSALFFKIGKNVFDGEPVERFRIPVVSKFKQKFISVSVTETVYIPPVYLWQIRKDSGFPSAHMCVCVNNDSDYHLHIAKRDINIANEFQDSMASVHVISAVTESFNERIEDADVTAHSKTLINNIEESGEEIITTLNIVELVLEDIIELSLDTFVFNHTYLYLTPKSRTKIYLSFTKPLCLGSHHCFYDLKFYDTETEEIMLIKTVKVFAEILPHPIQIHPMMLDMSLAPVIHGFCEDNIIITNTHKSYPVTIKIKLTTKMKKLLRVDPMEIFIPEKSSAKICFKLCCKDAVLGNTKYMAYFNFKIIVIGDKSLYKNVPPFFYEVIAPCASSFKSIYSDKYFLDTTESLNS